MAEIRKKGDSASKKELDTLKDMRIVQEMYARGFEFVPIDLYTAKAQRFQIVDGKLMPSLATIDGLGDKAADAVVDAAKQGKFLSKDDFRDRTKVSKTVIDLMDDLKLFGDIPQSNQMSLFDFYRMSINSVTAKCVAGHGADSNIKCPDIIIYDTGDGYEERRA